MSLRIWVPHNNRALDVEKMKHSQQIGAAYFIPGDDRAKSRLVRICSVYLGDKISSKMLKVPMTQLFYLFIYFFLHFLDSCI